MNLVWLSAALAQDLDDAAIVLAMRGEVRQQEPTPADLAPGDGLAEGSLVCTGVGAFATVRLAVSPTGRHDDVTLLPQTCLRVVSTSRHATDRASVLTLERGSVTLRQVDPDDHGSVVVQTNSGTTRGDGGGFRVHLEDGAARTEALYNAVSVEGAGISVAVGAGFGTRVHTGEAPQDPTRLPDPGTPTLPLDAAVLRVADFAWQPVPEAMAYRIEFASVGDFSDLLMADETPDAVYEPQVLFLPYRVPGLHWRVMSVDKYGFIGVPSDPRQLRFPAGVGP